MNRRALKVVDAIVVPPLRLLGFIFGGIYKLLFSGFDRRLALKHQQQLEQGIWRFVPFLFARDGARIVSKQIERVPPPFDYADVDVISPPLKFHFVRGRGEFDAYVTRSPAESSGHELSLVLSMLDLRPEVRRGSISDLSDVNRLLREYWEPLGEAFSDARYLELRKQLEGVYARDRVIAKQWEIEINRRLYGDR